MSCSSPCLPACILQFLPPRPLGIQVTTYVHCMQCTARQACSQLAAAVLLHPLGDHAIQRSHLEANCIPVVVFVQVLLQLSHGHIMDLQPCRLSNFEPALGSAGCQLRQVSASGPAVKCQYHQSEWEALTSNSLLRGPVMTVMPVGGFWGTPSARHIPRQSCTFAGPPSFTRIWEYAPIPQQIVITGIQQCTLLDPYLSGSVQLRKVAMCLVAMRVT